MTVFGEGFLIFPRIRLGFVHPIFRNQPEGLSNGRTTGHYENYFPQSGDGFIVISNRNAKRSARKGGAFLYPDRFRMKKLVAIALLVSTSIFSGCSVDWNDEKDKKITELEKRNAELEKSKDDMSFERRQECAKYIKPIEDEYRRLEKGGIYYFISLQEVFYSTSNATCYAVTWSKDQIGEYDEIKNVFTGERTIYKRFEKT